MTESAKVVPFADFAAVRAMIADAKPTRGTIVKEPVIHSQVPGQWEPDSFGLPRDCPVRPLGVSGGTMVLLDGIGQVRDIPIKGCGKLETVGLFGGELTYLEHHWPRFGKSGDDGERGPVAGFHNDDVVAVLVKACTRKGPWDAAHKMRGRGCWQDQAGGLVVHIGTAVISGNRAEAPGEVDEFVYPTRGEIPAPLSLREELPLKIGPILRPILESWSWGRPGIDPHLLLGWIGAAFLGGALPWRPMMWISGGAGTGKSTAMGLIKALLGDWLVETADTTGPGIYQRIGFDSVPIAVDELEADADDRKAAGVIKLARLASSGASLSRGGSDHKSTQFTARSAFLFSSINVPPLKPQDLSRMALLNLDKLRPGQPEPQIDGRVFGMVGRAILHQLIKQWPRFTETYEAFAGELAAAGMVARGQKQFGTLLTCADMILHDGWDEERLRFALDIEGDLVPWRELLRPSAMLEFENAADNWLGAIRHMLSVRVDAWRNGVRTTVGQVLCDYYEGEGDSALDITAANTLLSQAGLRIVHRPRQEGGKSERWLAVQNNNPLVRQLFQGEVWAGTGVWSGALRQAPKGLWMARRERVNGMQERATLLSLDGLYGPGGVMAEED